MTDLVKLTIPPDQASYAVKDGKEVLEVQLDGGAARRRRDILGATRLVNVRWSCNEAKFKYLRSFYRAITVSGSLPFNIDLFLDEPYLTTHKAYFVADSINFPTQQGLSFTVSAQLEVYPAEIGSYDSDYVHLYNEIGESFYVLDMLNTIVNVSLPADLPA